MRYRSSLKLLEYDVLIFFYESKTLASLYSVLLFFLHSIISV